jgi:hypothetical protein
VQLGTRSGFDAESGVIERGGDEEAQRYAGDACSLFIDAVSSAYACVRRCVLCPTLTLLLRDDEIDVSSLLTCCLPPPSSRPSRRLLAGDRWTFVKHGPELEIAFWEVLLEEGTKVKVTFDQAFRGKQ